MLKGFDTSAYPGDITMAALKKDFDFVGFYLAPAPSHRDTGWMIKLEALRRLKYKFMPIFVGQQVIGPGAHNSSKATGIGDAKIAAKLMYNAGFNHASPVYLDLENGAPMTDAQHDYVFAWIDEITALGYTPGVYCSHVLVPKFSLDKVRVWDFHVPTTSRTYSDVPVPPLADMPGGLAARQYRQNVVLRGTGILVDLDMAHDASGLAS